MNKKRLVANENVIHKLYANIKRSSFEALNLYMAMISGLGISGILHFRQILHMAKNPKNEYLLALAPSCSCFFVIKYPPHLKYFSFVEVFVQQILCEEFAKCFRRSHRVHSLDIYVTNETISQTRISK